MKHSIKFGLLGWMLLFCLSEAVIGTGTWVMLDKFKFYRKNMEV